MIIVVGLGNPGEKFNHTRHNAGFEALDFFAVQNNFPDFTLSKKYESEISEKDGVILVKPQTFMNDSGRAVQEILRNKNEVSLIIVRDDTDMELGKIKIVKESGSGGHKGVKSIIQAMGTKNFTQLKIGVSTGPEKAEEVVLKKFTPEEYQILTKAIQQSAEILKTF